MHILTKGSDFEIFLSRTKTETLGRQFWNRDRHIWTCFII